MSEPLSRPERGCFDREHSTDDAVTEITRLKADDGGPMDIGGATLAAAAMRAGLIDEYAIVTHPVLVGGGTPFFTALDDWVNLSLLETRPGRFPMAWC
jgi:dihydrofolate reductase